MFGPRRVFLAGIVLVAAGGLVGGFAQDLLTLLISRVLLGLGTSCAYPTAMLLIRRRAREAGLDQPPGGVLGGLQIAGAATGSLGLPVGGVLVGTLGWRAVFFVNVPVALAALAATLAWVSPDGPLDRTRSARDVAASLDVIGIAGFAAAMIALMLFLFDLPALRWYLLAISAGLWIALVLWELRARPVIAAALACLIGSAGVLLLSGSVWVGWVVLVTLAFGIALGAAAASTPASPTTACTSSPGS